MIIFWKEDTYRYGYILGGGCIGMFTFWKEDAHR